MALEVDTAPREVVVPPDLRRALAKSKAARAAFEKIPPSHQREYIGYIVEAKRPETRARRIERAVDRYRGERRFHREAISASPVVGALSVVEGPRRETRSGWGVRA